MGLVYLWALKIGTQPFIRHYQSQILTRLDSVERVGIYFLIGVALAEIEGLAELGGYWNFSSLESEGRQKAYPRAIYCIYRGTIDAYWASQYFGNNEALLTH